ncbi:hypothetical protein MTE01_30580 [Microbacterium testaceum]|uniref:Peptidase S8/S53 domain-containing protein n=1 Tax=Microbacterium testaceum TaxID=2033 RepID=A0A4Y3QR05_MICTE|nr:S8 family serine peptidase [Microbacterium testaceum]GEB47113.1 hypothetical protein MTE01_30580 [Microbacterium testaceum]
MSRRRLPGRIAAATLTALILGCGSVSAAAADTPKTWWYDAYGMEAIHAEGWTGKGAKIAVIDGNINPNLPAFAGRNLTVDTRSLCAENPQPTTAEVTEDSVHGTTLAAQIIGTGDGPGGVKGIAPDAEVMFYSFGTRNGETCTASEYADSLSPGALGVQRAIDAGAQIVTTSVLIAARPGDADVIANAIAKGVIIISATPNPTTVKGAGRGLGGFRGVTTAAAVDSTGALQKSPDGTPFALSWTTLVAPGVDLPTVGDTNGSWNQAETASGSSFAAPLVAGMLALVKQKYPDATGNQLIQSAIHNTGQKDHELAFDAASGFGYGLAWPAHFLRENPSQYPDENPLLAEDDMQPTDAKIASAVQRGSTYPPAVQADSSAGPADPRSGDASPQTQTTDTSWLPATIFTTLVIAVIAAAVIALVAVTRIRKKRAGAEQ